MRESGISPAGMGTLLSAFFWTYAFLQIPAGYLVDRFGLKWPYACAYLLWSAASAATGLASTFQQVLGLRALLGVGESVAPPASLAYIRQNFAEDEQGLPIAITMGRDDLGTGSERIIGCLRDRQPRLARLVCGDRTRSPGLAGPVVDAGASNPSAPAASQQFFRGVRLPWSMLLKGPTFWGVTITAFLYSYYSYFCLTWSPSYLMMARGYSFLRMGVYTAAPYVGTVLVSFAPPAPRTA